MWVVVIAAVFTLARFSEAFLILQAMSAGLALVFVPAVLVVMNIAYALAAYPAGVLSDNGDRTRVLIVGLILLAAADLTLALAPGLGGVALGSVPNRDSLRGQIIIQASKRRGLGWRSFSG